LITQTAIKNTYAPLYVFSLSISLNILHQLNISHHHNAYLFIDNIESFSSFYNDLSLNYSPISSRKKRITFDGLTIQKENSKRRDKKEKIKK